MDIFAGKNIIYKNMLVVCSNPKTVGDFNDGLSNIIKTLEKYYGQAVVFNITFIDPGDHIQASSNVIKGNFPHDVDGKFDIIWFAGCNMVNAWLFNEKDSITKFKTILKSDGIFFFTEQPKFLRINTSITPFVVLDDLLNKELQFILIEPEDIKKFYSHFRDITKPVENFKFIYRLK